jgi:hypothetical protein
MTSHKSPIVGNVTMTLLSPVSFKMPEGLAEYDNFPIMPIEDGGVTGYVPGSTFRGLIRRSAVMPMAVGDAANGQPWSLQRMYAELIGQDPNSEKESAGIDLDAIAQMRENSPILDLFGCGLMLKGRLQVSVLLPRSPTPPILVSYVRKDLDGTPDAITSLGRDGAIQFVERNAANRDRGRVEDEIKRIDRRLREHDRGRVKMDEGEHGEVLQARSKLEQDLQSLRERVMGMENSSLRPLSYMALPSGVVLTGRLVVDRPRDRDWEVLQTAFNAISLRPMIGAHTARGCGEFKMDIDFRQGGQLLRRFSIGGFEAMKTYETAEAAT